jgi:broad specificity phosphatase PhoE
VQQNSCGVIALVQVPVLFVSSPFSRALETATIIAKAVGINASDIEVQDNLRERFYGEAMEKKPAHGACTASLSAPSTRHSAAS